MIPTSFTSGTGTSAQQIPWIVEEPTVAYDRAVVIAYGSDGMVQPWEGEVMQHAKELAALGVLAVIPDYLAKNPPLKHGHSETVFQQILFRHAEWETVIRDAVAAVKSLPGIDAKRVGMLGLSLGGFLGLRIRDSVSCLMEYFAPYRFPTSGEVAVLKGIGPHANPSLKAFIQHGTADTLVPLNLNAEPIKSDLEIEMAVVKTAFHPGANHGFDGSDQQNIDARKKSLENTLEFFKTNL